MLGKFITHCEDSLTASVFTHLLHLPSEVYWQILSNACYSNLPRYPGEPSLITPWPNWDAEGTNNFSRVIPDLFMRFPGLDLIIEAKRGDYDMQNPEQWKDQVIAYTNEYGGAGEPTEVRMIALGGIWQTNEDIVTVERLQVNSGVNQVKLPTTKCPVHMCRWGRILTACQEMVRELEKSRYASSQTHANKRILAHLIELFSWHGFSTGLWFADFHFADHSLSADISPHLNLFHSRSRQLLTV